MTSEAGMKGRLFSRGMTLILLVLVPVLVSLFSVMAISYFSVAGLVMAGVGYPLGMVLVTLLGVGRLSWKQVGIIFVGTLLAPVVTLFLAAVMPASLTRAVPIPYGFYRLMVDFTTAAMTLWLVISCVMVLAFRRRLPVVVTPSLVGAAAVAGVMGAFLTLDEQGFPDQEHPENVRAVLGFLALCVPEVVLGFVFWWFGAYLRGWEVREVSLVESESGYVGAGE